jgi:hypothetical protein
MGSADVPPGVHHYCAESRRCGIVTPPIEVFEPVERMKDAVKSSQA